MWQRKKAAQRWIRNIVMLGRMVLLGICLVHCQGNPERPCTSVADCLGDELCQAGLCAALRACSSPGDCMGDESCTKGFCSSGSNPPPAPRENPGDGGPQDTPPQDTPPQDTPPQDQPKPGCQSDVDCASTQVCQGGQCRPKGPQNTCGSDNDCGDRQVCTGGKCAACSDDCQPSATQCSGNGFVRCVAQRGCGRWETNVQPCEQGKQCKAGKCLTGCSKDTDCKDGLVCSDGQCTKWCFGDKECNVGYRCIEQKCAVSCSSNTQCQNAIGFTCESGQCLKTFDVCKYDEDCPGGDLCGNGRCLTSCQNTLGCKEYHVCSGSKCVPSPKCAQDIDCAGGYRCSSGDRFCSTRCSQKYDCQSSFECNGLSKQCEPKSCTRESDCPGDLACDKGKCKARCVAHTDCRANYMCENGTCKQGCVDDSNCGGFACDTKEDYSCYSKCFRDADCKTGLLCDPNRQCVPPCKADADCQSGEICSNQICKDKSLLARGGADCDPLIGCATGYVCLNIASNGKLYRCQKACTSSCSSYYDTCRYGIGESKGPKGCFKDCSRASDCLYASKYKYTCSSSVCQLKLGSFPGGGKDYDRCETHVDCAKGYYCMHASTFNYDEGAVCLPKCSAYNDCGQDQSCRAHNAKPINSSEPSACYYSCSSSKKCPAIPNLSKPLYCNYASTSITNMCHVND